MYLSFFGFMIFNGMKKNDVKTSSMGEVSVGQLHSQFYL